MYETISDKKQIILESKMSIPIWNWAFQTKVCIAQFRFSKKATKIWWNLPVDIKGGGSKVTKYKVSSNDFLNPRGLAVEWGAKYAHPGLKRINWSGQIPGVWLCNCIAPLALHLIYLK